MKPAPTCDHMRPGDGSVVACPQSAGPVPCPACKGQGHRVTQDGTRPACGRCGGRGWLKPEFLPPAAADAAGTSPPPDTRDAGRAAFSSGDTRDG